MRFSKRPSASVLWAIFGLITLLFNWWAHHYPGFIEQWYSRGLFQGIRYAIDFSIAQLPFPSFYLFWIAVLAFWVWVYHRRPRLSLWRPKVVYWFSRLNGFCGGIVGLFFWMWGFNYARIPLDNQLGLNVQPLDSTTLWQELRSQTKALDSLRKLMVGNDTSALNDTRFWPANTEDTIRTAVEKWMASEGFPVGGRVRGRFIYPKGTLFKFGASGIYWPFVGEGNLESGMHPLRKLPSMAHEMSHGYGFSDEGACNFIAYVACADHSNIYIAYSARLDYWNTLANECLRNDRNKYEQEYKPGIPAGIVADERAIRKQHGKYTELAPALRYQVYDSYLKAQGVTAGMLSYDEVLMLVLAWRAAPENSQ